MTTRQKGAALLFLATAMAAGRVSGQTPVTLYYVTVDAAPGHSLTFTVGETSRLFATAVYTDGTRVDCTGESTWTSLDPSIVAVVEDPRGAIRATSGGFTTVRALCRGKEGGNTVSVGPGVRILGFGAFPYFVMQDTQVAGAYGIPVQAVVVDAAGATVRDCSSSALWTASNLVGSVQSDSSGLRFRVGIIGDGTVTARCGENVGQQHVRVGTPTLSGRVSSMDGAGIQGAYAGLSGNNEAPTFTNASGDYVTELRYPSSQIVASHVGFETATRDITWQGEATFTSDFTLQPVTGIFRQGQAANGSATTIGFQVPRAGTLRFAAHWTGRGGSFIENQVNVELTCNGSHVNGVPRAVFDGLGGGFRITADTSCTYALTLTPDFQPLAEPVVSYSLSMVPATFASGEIAVGLGIKAAHITELRTRIDALRTRYGLPAYAWTNPVLSAGVTPVSAQPVIELRTALQAAYAAAGATVPHFTDPNITPNGFLIKAIHITELRVAVAFLEG